MFFRNPLVRVNNRFIWLIYSILIILVTTSCVTKSNRSEQQDTDYIAPVISVIKHGFSQDKYNKNEMVRSNRFEQQDAEYIAAMIAVIKHRFRHEKYNNYSEVYVVLNGDSLPSEVQREFKKSRLKIKTIQSSEVDFNSFTKPYFNILDVQIINDNYEVVAYDFYDIFFSQIIRFYLKNKNGQWIVEDEIIEFVY